MYIICIWKKEKRWTIAATSCGGSTHNLSAFINSDQWAIQPPPPGLKKFLSGGGRGGGTGGVCIYSSATMRGIDLLCMPKCQKSSILLSQFFFPVRERQEVGGGANAMSGWMRWGVDWKKRPPSPFFIDIINPSPFPIIFNLKNYQPI